MTSSRRPGVVSFALLLGFLALTCRYLADQDMQLSRPSVREAWVIRPWHTPTPSPTPMYWVVHRPPSLPLRGEPAYLGEKCDRYRPTFWRMQRYLPERARLTLVRIGRGVSPELLSQKVWGVERTDVLDNLLYPYPPGEPCLEAVVPAVPGSFVLVRTEGAYGVSLVRVRAMLEAAGLAPTGVLKEERMAHYNDVTVVQDGEVLFVPDVALAPGLALVLRPDRYILAEDAMRTVDVTEPEAPTPVPMGVIPFTAPYIRCFDRIIQAYNQNPEFRKLVLKQQNVLSAYQSPEDIPRTYWILPLESPRLIISGSLYREVVPSPRGTMVTHLGVDLAGNLDLPVRAVDDGVVVAAGFDEIFGWFVDIDHLYGYATRYAHMQRINPDVSCGTRVTRGQPLGPMGSSGFSSGPHLHFSIWFQGTSVDPIQTLGPNRFCLRRPVSQDLTFRPQTPSYLPFLKKCIELALPDS